MARAIEAFEATLITPAPFDAYLNGDDQALTLDQKTGLSLFMDIQRQYRTTLLFISHDLSLVRYLADRVVVMYLGNIVEQGTTDEVFAPPYHPYTEALLSAVPIADTSIEKKRIILEGVLPSVVNPPKGCPFNTRCPRKIGDICETEKPPEIEASSGHMETIRANATQF